MEKPSSLIECVRFGGKRPAPACIHFDRYRSCRRKCKALEKYMRDNPDWKKVVEERYSVKEKTEDRQLSLFALPAESSCKGVPDPDLACQRCKFIAKSVKGLKIHMRRTHRT